MLLASFGPYRPMPTGKDGVNARTPGYRFTPNRIPHLSATTSAA
jgi:hypothetical protein